jgi:hypothetical protein
MYIDLGLNWGFKQKVAYHRKRKILLNNLIIQKTIK